MAATGSVALQGNGQPTEPWEASVRRSLDIGNTLEEHADGLFVGEGIPSPVVIADTNTINLSGDGTGGSPISAVLQPAPYAHVTGTGSVPADTNTDLTLGTTVELTGLTYSAPSVVVSAGNGGLYTIYASATFPSGTGNFRSLNIFLNGSAVAAVVLPPVSGIGMTVNVSTVIRLAAGDAIKLQAHNSGFGSAATIPRVLRMTRTGI